MQESLVKTDLFLNRWQCACMFLHEAQSMSYPKYAIYYCWSNNAVIKSTKLEKSWLSKSVTRSEQDIVTVDYTL